MRLRVRDAGTAHVVVRDAEGVAGSVVTDVAATRSGHATVVVPLDRR